MPYSIENRGFELRSWPVRVQCSFNASKSALAIEATDDELMQGMDASLRFTAQRRRRVAVEAAAAISSKLVLPISKFLSSDAA